jgi:hypothetical protein
MTARFPLECSPLSPALKKSSALTSRQAGTMMTRLHRGRSAVTMRHIAKPTTRWVGRSRSRNSTISRKSRASPNAAPMTPNASLMEWKKVKFMQDRVGEDFRRLHHQRHQVRLLRRTHRFVRRRPGSAKHAHRRLLHLPREHAPDHRPAFAQDLQPGQRIRVLVDRIDPVEKKIQFAILEEKPLPSANEKKRQ